jgi:hypothetical protein
VSRVRENRMHGSTRRREETGTSRASTSRTEPGASRRPDRASTDAAYARTHAGAVATPVFVRGNPKHRAWQRDVRAGSYHASTM